MPEKEGKKKKEREKRASFFVAPSSCARGWGGRFFALPGGRAIHEASGIYGGFSMRGKRSGVIVGDKEKVNDFSLSLAEGEGGCEAMQGGIYGRIWCLWKYYGTAPRR